MHSRFRAKGTILAVLAALTALLVLPGALVAKPRPDAPGRGFRLQARAIGAITINRVYCGIAATGEVCVDSTNSSTIGGGYWPKGSPMQYVFNSGLQAAGLVDTAGGWAWAGDTTGAFFFNARGGGHGGLVQPIWNSSSAADQAAWPDAALVPKGDAVADLFFPTLQGERSASEGDIWTIAWDGDPAQATGRPHPLGIAVETRGLGWNFPTGNEDIVYFIYTFYNVTSACDADYAAIRPEMRPVMRGLGTQFQTLNNAAFGVTIPNCGYTIKDFYANFAADMDVADAGLNYASVNIPFALGYAYEDAFSGPPGSYRLPSDIAKPGLLPGFGFVGVKYLKSPVVAGNEVGIALFSNTTNGAPFPDPQNMQQLYRYISGTINPGLGDGSCNYIPLTDKICYIQKAQHLDVRFFQSSGPFDLAPGQFGSIVVGYLFASAVAVPGCPTPGCTAVKPGEPLLLNSAAGLAANGANLIDSLTGFAGYTDINSDGVVQQSEFTVVKGSLLDKASVAQAVFNSGFLLPAPPAPPEFFLVPGDNQVAVFWRPTVTETTGDIYFAAASQPKVLEDPDGGGPLPPVLVNNPLYDPNYRQLDVEGYRVYRGRVDDPLSLTMLAQYDYDNTTFSDYLGIVNPTPDCAPELGVETGCPVNFDNPPPGTAYTVSSDYDVASPFIQVKLGDRTLLGTGDAIVLKADTAVTGTLSVVSGAELANTGVPLVYVDKTARNNIRYFYSVAAFDVNSIQSGPTSLESARLTKSATPFHAASNYDNEGVLSIGMFGRGVNMTQAIPRTPTIDGTTGIFSGPARPATGASIGFVGDFVKQVITQSGEMSLTLIAMRPGSAYSPLIATEFTFVQTSAAGVDTVTVSVTQDQFSGSVSTSGVIDNGPINNERAARYGGSSAYHVKGSYELNYEGNYFTLAFGRGCANGDGFDTSPGCDYNGPRWFAGANETFPHPTRGNNQNSSNVPMTVFTNAGSVPGVANIWQPRSYATRPNFFRVIEGVLGTITTAADYRVYWGVTPGRPDSVIDITHNVPVAFDTIIGYSWGILTTGATAAVGSKDTRPGVLTTADLGCVNPLHTYGASNPHLGCAGGTFYNFVNTAALGDVAFSKDTVEDRTLAARPNQGFGMYLAGHFFLFEMSGATLPASTVWTMRSYVGAIDGGGGTAGAAGNDGAYSFTAHPSPFTAVGASLKAEYSVSNALHSTTEADLDAVHTVPDPYYVMNGFERTASGKVIKFVNLPDRAIVRIYSTSGVLVRVLEHASSTFNGTLDWDVRNRNNQIVASGVYFYAIESASGARRTGRMTIVNFAQ